MTSIHQAELRISAVFLLFLLSAGASRADPPLTIHWTGFEDRFPGDNSDGMVSPGEKVLLTIELENQSENDTYYRVTGSLEGDTAYSSVVSKEAFFGDIAPRQRAEAQGGFELEILPQAPTDSLLSLDLILSDSTGFLDTLSLSVYLVARADSLSTPTKWVYPGEGMRINAYFVNGQGMRDPGGIDKVFAEIRTGKGELVGETVLWDDGGHNDGAPRDGNFGNTWWTMPYALDYRVSLRMVDILGRYDGEKKDFSGFTTRDFSRQGDILLVNDDRSSSPSEEAASYYRESLSGLGLEYSYWYSWYRGDIDTTAIHEFLQDGVVIWCAPHGGRIRSRAPIQKAVGSYLERGGKLLIASGGLSQHIAAFGSEEDSLFLARYLHARPVTGFDPEDYRETVRGVGDDPISDGLSLWIVGNRGISQYYADEIDPLPPAVPVFAFEPRGTSSSTAALRVDNGTYRIVYFTFGLEGVGERFERERVLARALTWLKYGQEEAEDRLEQTILLLLCNSPNPFSSETRISYELPAPGWVTLQICNLSGRVARVLANEEQDAGAHSLFWDGKDSFNRELANGYYFYRLAFRFQDPETQGQCRWVTTSKMLLLR